MSAPVVFLGMAWVLLLAFTVALVLSRASREREIRRDVAAQIRQHADAVARFQPNGAYVAGMQKAARIAAGPVVEHSVSSGFLTIDSGRRARSAGDWRRSS